MANCHSNKAPISCNICHKTLSTKNTLQAHHKKFHSSTTRPRIPCPSPPCDKTYFDKIAITDHVRREHNENPTKFPCTLCGKEFKMKAHLNSHIAFHTTEKPYKCLTCGRRFAQTSNFKSHQVKLKNYYKWKLKIPKNSTVKNTEILVIHVYTLFLKVLTYLIAVVVVLR